MLTIEGASRQEIFLNMLLTTKKNESTPLGVLFYHYCVIYQSDSINKRIGIIMGCMIYLMKNAEVQIFSEMVKYKS